MIEIQEMTAADVADIAALERLCFSAPWSENSIAEELETGFSLWLVARLDGADNGAALLAMLEPVVIDVGACYDRLVADRAVTTGLSRDDDGLAAHTDALAKAIGAAGGKQVQRWHVPTDHSWSDRRILLESIVIEWLEGLPAN